MAIGIYLIIVVFSVAQSATTKLFHQGSANSAVFNAVKSLTSLVLFALMAIPGFTLHPTTLFFGVLYGACLCASLYAGYQALCRGPMALTSMLVSFSVFIPILWGFTVGGEQISVLQLAALILLIAAIVLSNADALFERLILRRMLGKDAMKNRRGIWLLFVGITFLCNGACSVLQKQHQSLFPDAYNREFMLFAVLFCSIVFCAILPFRVSFSEFRQTKGKWLAALSGIANGLANFLTLLLASFENASVLFPIISVGTLLCAILCGKFMFKEELKLNHYLALAIGILAVLFLKL